MLVKMTNGSFCLKEKMPDGSVHVAGKTRSDPPFEVDAELGAELISRGVAVEVQPDNRPPEPAPVPPAQEDTADTETEEVTEAQLRKMKKADLLAIAAQKGIDVDENTRNADIVDLILAETGDEADSDELPPEPAPEMPE